MTVFIFTDIEGSSRLWREYGAEMAAALERHDALLREFAARFGGRVVKSTGDGAFVVFNGGDPIGFARSFRRGLAVREGSGELELRARTGIHVGEAEERGGDFYGPDVNKAARLCNVAWGGQIVLSAEAARAAVFPPEVSVRSLGVHVLKDIATPVEIFQLVSGDAAGDEFPPLRSLSPKPRNLPPQATPFVDRPEESAALRALLRAEGCRLLTLLGPGGAGKTRLALQAAADNADLFSWGVYFVPLAPLAGPAYVVTAVAEALGFSFYGPREPHAQLLGYLRGKNLLLVLDNFEHITAAAPLIAEILDAAPAVKTIVTSRARLDLRSERVYEVGGMTYPASAAADDFEHYSAVALFLEAATRVRTDFRLAPDDRAPLVRICEAVRGTPLALELAASWVRVMSVADIAAELAEGFDLLATSAVDVDARHRSLGAVFDYSYGLLDDGERRILTALAVFRGGFERDAATAVAGANLGSLASLVDKSLLAFSPPTRYRLHEMVRHYAAEKLEQTPDAYAEVRARHAGYYARFVEDNGKRFGTEKQRESFAAIVREIDNIRAAWAEIVERRDVAGLERAVVLLRFYSLASLLAEGLEAAEHAIRVFENLPPGSAALPPKLAVALWNDAGSMAQRTGRFDQAWRRLRSAVAVAKRSGLQKELAAALTLMSSICFAQQRPRIGVSIAEAAVRIARAAGDDMQLASSLNNAGAFRFLLGDCDGAGIYFRESLGLGETHGNLSRVSAALNNLCTIEYTRGHLTAARDLARQSLEAARSQGYRTLVSYALNSLAFIVSLLGEDDEAAALLAESIDIKRELNDFRELQVSLANAAAVFLRQGRREDARRAAAEALALAREHLPPEARVGALVRYADVETAAGDAAAAKVYLNEASRSAGVATERGAVGELVAAKAAYWAAHGDRPKALAIAAALVRAAPRPSVTMRARALLRRLAPEGSEDDLRTEEEAGRSLAWEDYIPVEL